MLRAQSDFLLAPNAQCHPKQRSLTRTHAVRAHIFSSGARNYWEIIAIFKLARNRGVDILAETQLLGCTSLKRKRRVPMIFLIQQRIY